MIYSTKVKVSRLLPKVNDCGDYLSFKKRLNTGQNGCNLLHADNQDITRDEACQVATETWREVMNNHNLSQQDVLVSFREYMELIKLKDKDFSYQILADDSGEITGCFWMTATMRKNFELYGGFFSVDTMNRDINILLWPYMATTMHNDMGQVCVGCEGIIISEREEAYEAMLNFQAENSRRKKTDVYGISADGFLSQDIIRRFGFTSATFVMDYWHLFNKVRKE